MKNKELAFSRISIFHRYDNIGQVQVLLSHSLNNAIVAVGFDTASDDAMIASRRPRIEDFSHTHVETSFT
jgi:hypothetical protein